MGKDRTASNLINRVLTINGQSYDLSANRTWTVAASGGAGGPANANTVETVGAATVAVGVTEAQMLLLNFTPTSITSKIIIIAKIDFIKDATTTVRTATARIRRGTLNTDTQIGVDSVANSSAVASTPFGPGLIVVYDQPGTISPIDYTLRALSGVALTATRISLVIFELSSKGDTGATSAPLTTVSTSAPSGTPIDGQEWVVYE